MYPEELKYLDTHQWVKIEADIGKIGITSYGQKQLGEILLVELPKVGTEVTYNKTFATIESSKTAFEVPSPVSGKVIEINAQLEEDPSLVNKDPYGDGWMIKVKISQPEEIDTLLNAQEYEKLVEE
ncbi:MAG: glycine cleavage system protein GcvH [Clostridia bacterium]|jgi:glycine cleavage system H protein|nr:glycine cleavage system protein GcvH [Clostridia bacterium]